MSVAGASACRVTGAKGPVATAYAPPEHEHGTVHATKAAADEAHEH